MFIRICVGKIHRATVTEADLDYVGSITIDADLLKAAGMHEYQMVNITNLSNGVLWQTYTMAGPAGRGDICLNGPPARHFHKGDKVIILAEALCTMDEHHGAGPTVVFVDDKNKITKVQEHPAPGTRSAV